MSRVFSKETSKFFRFKVWLRDLTSLFFALPSYLNPKPIETAPLTDEEKQLFQELTKNEEPE